MDALAHATLAQREAVRRDILELAAREPFLERGLPERLDRPDSTVSNAMAFLVEMRWLCAVGLRWRLTEAGREQARALEIEVPEPAAPAPAPATARKARAARRAPAAGRMGKGRQAVPIAPPPEGLDRNSTPRPPRPRAAATPGAESERMAYLRDLAERKAAAAAAGVPYTRKLKENPSPRALYARDLRARKAAARAAQKPFTMQRPPLKENVTASALKQRDIAARKRAAAAAGVPFVPKPRGRKPKASAAAEPID